MANIREIVRASVAEILAENGRGGNFCDDTSLVGGALLSSMDLLAVMIAVETAGVNVTGVPLEKIDTINDIVSQLESRSVLGAEKY